MFNDPNLDQSIIPDDEVQREGLRVGLLVSDWGYRKVGSLTIFGTILDNSKLVTYYYTQHVNINQPLFTCRPLQYEGSPQFIYCLSYTKERIEKLDFRGTFQYIWEFQRDKFLVDIVILPLVSLIGIFGMDFHYISFILFLKLFLK